MVTLSDCQSQLAVAISLAEEFRHVAEGNTGSIERPRLQELLSRYNPTTVAMVGVITLFVVVRLGSRGKKKFRL